MPGIYDNVVETSYGTYTPVTSALANLSSTTTYVCQWSKVGSVVTVSGRIDVDPVTASTLTYFNMTLPFASALSPNGTLGGTISGDTMVGPIQPGGTDVANVSFITSMVLTPSQAMRFSFTYRIV